MEEIKIPISIGEFFDRLSILEIKMELIEDEDKRSNVFQELSVYKNHKACKAMVIDLKAYELYQKLKQVNRQIWKHIAIQNQQIKEDNLDADFVGSSASVILLNNERFLLKKDLNDELEEHYRLTHCREVKAHV